MLKKKITTGEPVWLDQEYKKARASRRKLEKAWKKSRSDVDRANYMEQKQICAEMVLTKQTNHYSKIINEAGSCH